MKKHSKLLTVLLFDAMVLILGLLVASVTSCSPTSETIQPTPTVQPSLIVKPTPTWIPDDGTVYHPYDVDASSVVPGITWSVQTATKREQWTLNQLHTLKAGEFIWYSNAKYRVLVINRKALTMSVSGPLDCCAGDEG